MRYSCSVALGGIEIGSLRLCESEWIVVKFGVVADSGRWNNVRTIECALQLQRPSRGDQKWDDFFTVKIKQNKYIAIKQKENSRNVEQLYWKCCVGEGVDRRYLYLRNQLKLHQLYQTVNHEVE